MSKELKTTLMTYQIDLLKLKKKDNFRRCILNYNILVIEHKMSQERKNLYSNKEQK